MSEGRVSTGGREFGYQPALDGLRAIAVAMVLVFHLDLGFYDGGYLGVSVFFTLSGYLITSLLLRERERTGRISATAFYLRRIRRLLPASLACITIVAVLAAVGAYDRSGDVRPNVLGALFQVQNWVSLARDQSYADLFAAPSPLDHFWSLAIEEQFYWVWPVSVAALGAVAARRHSRGRERRGELPLLVVLFVASAASAPLTRVLLDADAVYFASWTRVAEILAGACLAAVLVDRRVPRRSGAALAWLGLAGVLVAGAVIPAGRGPAYAGALPVFALVSTALIAGLQAPGTLPRLLASRPFVALGRISFGVYLYHWPIFVLLDATRTGLGRWPLAAARLAVTLVVSVASFHLLERPIRERRVVAAPRRLVGGVVTAAMCIAVFGVVAVAKPAAPDVLGAGVTLAPADSLTPLVPLTSAARADGVDASTGSVPASATTRVPNSAPTATPISTSIPSPGPSSTATSSATSAPVVDGGPAVSSPETPPATDPANGGGAVTSAVVVAPERSTAPGDAGASDEVVPPRPVRMLVVGDSTAQALGHGIASWALERPDLAEVEVMAFPGCGLLAGGARLFAGEWSAVPDGCSALFDVDVPARLARVSADIVVVITSFWDVTDHRWADDGNAPRTPFDPVFARRLLDRFTTYNEVLLRTPATKVVWVQHPAVDYRWDDSDEPADDPARYEVLAETIRAAAVVDSARVRVVEFAEWVTGAGLDTDRDARPDGVHFTAESATDVTREWLGRELLHAALT